MSQGKVDEEEEDTWNNTSELEHNKLSVTVKVSISA